MKKTIIVSIINQFLEYIAVLKKEIERLEFENASLLIEISEIKDDGKLIYEDQLFYD